MFEISGLEYLILKRSIPILDLYRVCSFAPIHNFLFTSTKTPSFAVAEILLDLIPFISSLKLLSIFEIRPAWYKKKALPRYFHHTSDVLMHLSFLYRFEKLLDLHLKPINVFFFFKK